MKYLTVMRHAEAVDSASNDFDRPLSENGIHQAQIIARKLTGFVKPDYFVVSPSVRTKETVNILLKAFDYDQSVCYFESSLYAAEAEVLKEVIKNIPAKFENVVVVGHNPAISDLFSSWTGYYSYFPAAQAVVIKCLTDDWQNVFDGTVEVVVKVCCKE